MIKFKELVHKETGISIAYLDWLKSYEQNGDVGFCGDRFELYPSDDENEEFRYTPPCKWIMRTKDILFSDKFKIVYDADFTADEINIIDRLIDDYIEKNQGISILTQEFEIKNKINKLKFTS